MFAQREESEVLISSARGIERAATAVRSSPCMSVQPEIPILVSVAPPSRDGGLFANAEVCTFSARDSAVRPPPVFPQGSSFEGERAQ